MNRLNLITHTEDTSLTLTATIGKWRMEKIGSSMSPIC